MSLEDDWVEVTDVPVNIDQETGKSFYPLENDHTLCFVDEAKQVTSFARTPEEKPISEAGIVENNNELSTSISAGSERVSTSLDNRVDSAVIDSNHSSHIPDESHTSSLEVDQRDAKIALLERRIKAMEHGIQSLHTWVHANPGIRQTLKSAVLSTNDHVYDDDCSSISVPASLEDLSEEIAYELTDVLEAAQKLGNILSKPRQDFPKLSFLNFQIGDIALFMPAISDNRRVWMAFNSGCPNYYLSQVSLSLIEPFVR